MHRVLLIIPTSVFITINEINKHRFTVVHISETEVLLESYEILFRIYWIIKFISIRLNVYSFRQGYVILCLRARKKVKLCPYVYSLRL